MTGTWTMSGLRARFLAGVAAVTAVVLIGVAVPAHAAPIAVISVQVDAPSSPDLAEISISGDASGVAPGEGFHVLAHRWGLPAVTGRFEFTVPEHVEVVGMQHQAAGQLAFTLHDDGRTARSVSSTVSLPAGIFMLMRLSDDAPSGALLEGGSMRMLSADGQALAAGTFSVTTLGLPSVLEQPTDTIVDVGNDAVFTTSVSGHGVSTQWQVWADGDNPPVATSSAWSDIDGATGTTLRVEATTPEMTRWRYRAVHTNAAGSVVTDPAMLGVRTAPYFRVHPSDFARDPGQQAFIGAVASDNVDRERLSFTWEMSRDGLMWVPYEPGTFPDVVFPTGLALLRIAAEMDGLRFRLVAENDLGRTESDPAVLTVRAAPVIDSHPADVRTLVGRDAEFSATTPAVSPHRTQQWQQRGAGGDWVDIPGATQAEYSTGPTTLALDQTEYRIVFTNAHGRTASEPATLTVRPSLRASVSVTASVRLVDRLP